MVFDDLLRAADYPICSVFVCIDAGLRFPNNRSVGLAARFVSGELVKCLRFRWEVDAPLLSRFAFFGWRSAKGKRLSGVEQIGAELIAGSDLRIERWCSRRFDEPIDE